MLYSYVYTTVVGVSVTNWQGYVMRSTSGLNSGKCTLFSAPTLWFDWTSPKALRSGAYAYEVGIVTKTIGSPNVMNGTCM